MKRYLLLTSLIFFGLFSYLQATDDIVLSSILQNDELIVVTRNAPTTYFNWHDEFTGLEHDMTQAFARELGVKIKYLIKDSTSEILSAIKNGEAHIAAAGLTRTDERQSSFLFGPIYQHAEQQVVCRKGGKSPKNITDLADIKLVVPADTSYEERLTSLKQEHPELAWSVNQETETEDLLEQVWLRKIDCTIADSNITSINRRYYPELKVSFNITDPEPLTWMLPAKASSLQSRLEDWFDDFKESGKLALLMDRYYGYVEKFDYVDTRKFVRRIYKVLPKYRKVFEQAASKYGFDWTLLAAQAYQESHWRAAARSPTGVRGMMMLTLTTARELGVKSRLNPEQSIMGGARYLKNLYQRIPDDVQDPDRIWFALAAYNVGMGHLYDARTLAKTLGKNPNTWSSLSEVFPLLSKKKHYKTLKYGYARGSEAVSYVRHIRDYQNILVQRLNNGL